MELVAWEKAAEGSTHRIKLLPPPPPRKVVSVMTEFAQGIPEAGGIPAQLESEVEQGGYWGEDDIYAPASGMSGMNLGSGKGRRGRQSQQEEQTTA